MEDDLDQLASLVGCRCVVEQSQIADDSRCLLRVDLRAPELADLLLDLSGFVPDELPLGGKSLKLLANGRKALGAAGLENVQ